MDLDRNLLVAYLKNMKEAFESEYKKEIDKKKDETSYYEGLLIGRMNAYEGLLEQIENEKSFLYVEVKDKKQQNLSSSRRRGMGNVHSCMTNNKNIIFTDPKHEKNYKER